MNFFKIIFMRIYLGVGVGEGTCLALYGIENPTHFNHMKQFIQNIKVNYMCMYIHDLFRNSHSMALYKCILNLQLTKSEI